MASRCRRYRARRFKALGYNPQLLVIRPTTPPTSLDHLKPFKLSTALMAVHKACYAPIGLIQQGGTHRRETVESARDRPIKSGDDTEWLFDSCESEESNVGRYASRRLRCLVLRCASPSSLPLRSSYAGHASPYGPRMAAPRVARRAKRGAQGRNRTTDTAI